MKNQQKFAIDRTKIMIRYPFQDYEEKYIFIRYYSSSNFPQNGCFIVVAPEKRPSERLFFYFFSGFCSWRLLFGPLLDVYRKKLNDSNVIASNQQFTLYSNTDYIKIFCRYSGQRLGDVKHLSFDLETVIVEILFPSNIYVIRCLGEGIT